MLKSIGLLVIAALPLLAQDAGHLRGTHSGAHTIPGERSAGRPRRRARAAATLPPSISPPSWRWPERSRRATTAPTSRRCRWWASRPSRTPRWAPRRGARAWTFAGATISSAPARRSGPTRASKARRCSWGTGSRRRSSSGTISKGVDVTGKVLVLFTNEPPSTDPKFFDGRALTYYGRWVYKYEEALRRGAQGLHHHPHHADGQLRLGRGAQFVGPGSAVRETGAGRRRRCRSRAG